MPQGNVGEARELQAQGQIHADGAVDDDLVVVLDAFREEVELAVVRDGTRLLVDGQGEGGEVAGAGLAIPVEGEPAVLDADVHGAGMHAQAQVLAGHRETYGGPRAPGLVWTHVHQAFHSDVAEGLDRGRIGHLLVPGKELDLHAQIGAEAVRQGHDGGLAMAV